MLCLPASMELSMQLIVHIPDEMVAPVRDKLPPPEMGVLEAIALDTLLSYLFKLRSAPNAKRPPSEL